MSRNATVCAVLAHCASRRAYRLSEFSDWFSRVMDARGFKLRDFGERVGRSPNTVRSWKLGLGVPPSLADCDKIAGVFEEDVLTVRTLAGYQLESAEDSPYVIRIRDAARQLEGTELAGSLALVVQSLLEKHQSTAP